MVAELLVIITYYAPRPRGAFWNSVICLSVCPIVQLSRPEVFNLCHAVDPTEMPSSGGGPHGPRRTGFNLP